MTPSVCFRGSCYQSGRIQAGAQAPVPWGGLAALPGVPGTPPGIVRRHGRRVLNSACRHSTCRLVTSGKLEECDHDQRRDFDVPRLECTVCCAKIQNRKSLASICPAALTTTIRLPPKAICACGPEVVIV